MIIAAVVAGSFLAMVSQPPFGQDQEYHRFADARGFLGIPNFGDVASNVAFLIAGIAGLKVCFTRSLGRLAAAWFVTFAGIALVGVASAYYHWNPNDQTLVWDRMALTVGFTGLFVAVLGEYINERFSWLLWPAVLLGVFSVLYWHWFGDLRFYYWTQLIPLLTLPFLMALYRPGYTHQWLLLAGALWYGFAKLAELWDKVVFAATQGIISGHTIKHLLAGVGCWSIALYLKQRHEPDRSADLAPSDIR